VSQKLTINNRVTGAASPQRKHACAPPPLSLCRRRRLSFARDRRDNTPSSSAASAAAAANWLSFTPAFLFSNGVHRMAGAPQPMRPQTRQLLVSFAPFSSHYTGKSGASRAFARAVRRVAASVYWGGGGGVSFVADGEGCGWVAGAEVGVEGEGQAVRLQQRYHHRCNCFTSPCSLAQSRSLRRRQVPVTRHYHSHTSPSQQHAMLSLPIPPSCSHPSCSCSSVV
jgi:hypothetical protein